MADTTRAERVAGIETRIRRADDDVTRAALIALRRLLVDSKATLAAAGFNVDALSANSPAWLSAIDTALAPALVRTFTEAWDEIAQGTVEASPYAARHLEAVTNRLVRVPDTVFDTIRVALNEGREAGETIPQLAKRVDGLMADQERWRNRAIVIARTEVIAANNEGMRGAAGAIGDASGVPRSLIAKEWLATSDGRTRESHSAADGQIVVGLDTPFGVGGAMLVAPGDPNGPADEVVQCRCTVLYHFPGDPSYPSLTAGAAMADEQNTSTVIVALPAEDDPIQGIGPEQKHSTLLWFGEVDDATADGIRAAVQEAIDTDQWGAFDQTAETTDLLGDDDPQAVVLHLATGDSMLESIRGTLLDTHYDTLREAWEAQKQWPTFTPHVTLGYGDEVTNDDRATADALSSITFDRLAVWQGDRQDEYALAGGDVSEQTPEPEVVTENAWHGVWTVEGLMSGDGRQFDAGVLRARPLPLPLMYMPETQMGHDGAVLAGRVDVLVRVGNEIRAAGVWDLDGANGAEARRQLSGGFFRGVSVDVDDAKAEFQFPDGTPVPADWWPEPGDPEPEMHITDGRIAAATLCAIPAFAEAYVADGPAPEGFLNGDPLDGSEHGNTAAVEVADAPADGEETPDTQESLDAEAQALLDDPAPDAERAAAARALLARYEAVDAEPPSDLTDLAAADADTSEEAATTVALVAAALGFRPPAAAFANPMFEPGDGRTVRASDGSWGCPLTITDDGYVFGHVAKWGTCHIGFQNMTHSECITPPFSATNYAYFATGVVTCADGSKVHVGSLTYDCGHADTRLGWRPAASHYDNTGSVLADLAIGQDDLGIWVAGYVRPGVPDHIIDAAMASGAVSGDWRDVGGESELVAALLVNVPGFPMPRVAAGLTHNRQTALVASGVVAHGTPSDVVDQTDLVRLAATRVRRLSRLEAVAASIRENRVRRLAATADRLTRKD